MSFMLRSGPATGAADAAAGVVAGVGEGDAVAAPIGAGLAISALDAAAVESVDADEGELA
jgi:hypothetical protein